MSSNEEQVMQRVLGSFDPDAFMLAEYQEALDTERTLLPAGEVRIETITDFEILKPKLWKDPKTGEQIWLRPTLRLQMLIKDQGVLEAINCRRDEYTWRYGFKLDINENGRLDMGPNRNIELGRVRAAAGQNIPGVNWSILQLKNCNPFYVTVQHRAMDDGAVFENVSKWYKPGEGALEQAA